MMEKIAAWINTQIIHNQGSDAKFIIAGGPLAGTLAPSFGRVSAGGKSPRFHLPKGPFQAARPGGTFQK